MWTRMIGNNLKNMGNMYQAPVVETLEVEISFDILSASGEDWKEIED